MRIDCQKNKTAVQEQSRKVARELDTTNWNNPVHRCKQCKPEHMNKTIFTAQIYFWKNDFWTFKLLGATNMNQIAHKHYEGPRYVCHFREQKFTKVKYEYYTATHVLA